MWKKRNIDTEKENLLLKQGKSKLLSRLLAQRDVDVQDTDKFLSSSYEDISHPHTLKGVEEGVELFINVARKKGNVAVIGDYDCDGIISSVMIKGLCNIFDLSCDVFLPSRFKHGYGLNDKTLEDFKKMIGDKAIDLLIVLDCGTNNENEIHALRDMSISSILIIDHHLVDESTLSKSADVLINWHLGGTGEMCTCGEVFQFIRGIRWRTKKVNPVEFLSYASIGTLADVSALTTDNRIIVKNGLTSCALSHVVLSGLTALISKSKIYGPLTQEDVLFKICPKINAVGRIKDPMIAYRLLIEHDPTKAELMADALQGYNEDRKKIQKQIEMEAVSLVMNNLEKYKHGIVVYNSDWHIGVTGIVASRLVDTFCKPSLVIGNNEGLFKGSGRSVAEINLKEILDKCSEVFIGYGGHAMAAGVTLKPDYLDKANEIFNKACKEYYEENHYPQEIRYYDSEISAKFVSPKIAQILIDNLYPYCDQNNPQPVFLLSNAKIVDTELREGDNWRLLTFSAVQGSRKTEFKMKMFTDTFGTEIDGTFGDIYFTFPQSLSENSFKTQINVLDFIPKK